MPPCTSTTITRSIFPPGTQYVTHHHKREFTTWPIATTRYGGYDFRPGTDVSWFKNHSAANSMFAWNYADDFFAGYDHGKQAGTMSVADHHIVPGKKLWTWGNGPRGRMWDKILTDEDGPYIELMVGGYSDNQPDYSWLQPFEVKSFSMFWYPFRQIGGVKKANLDAAVNLEVRRSRTGPRGLLHDGPLIGGQRCGSRPRVKVVLEESVDIDPGKPYVKEVSRSAGNESRRPPRLDRGRWEGTGELHADRLQARADAPNPIGRRQLRVRSRPARNST